MCDEKKIPTPETDENEKTEVNLEELENVLGGSLRDVIYTTTTEISEDVIEKI